MKAELIAHDGEELTIQIKVKITGSLFETEHLILDACNQVGQLASFSCYAKLCITRIMLSSLLCTVSF
jgi:hypothetical protein